MIETVIVFVAGIVVGGLLAPVSRLVGALNIEMFGNAMPHRAVHRAG